jgi:tetratricopeptide (TPR) repeat protein
MMRLFRGPAAGGLVLAALLSSMVPVSGLNSPSEPGQCVLLTALGTIEVAPAGSASFVPAHANQVLQTGDQIRSGKNSRATVRLSDLTVIRVYELTTMTVRPPANAQQNAVIEVKSGAAYFFNRDKPNQTQFETPSSSGAIRGTEFALSVDDNGRTELALIDGQVAISNSYGSIQLQSGEQAVVEKNQAPQKSPLLNAINIIQWTLYYPAILDTDELEMSAESKQELAASLAAYRSGDLLQALSLYPAGRMPESESERVYRAAVLLAVGNVDAAQSLLNPAIQESRAAALADALKEMIATAKGQPPNRTAPRTLATEWMAGSYQAQSRRDLKQARSMALNATVKAPGFGFAQERLAELEFSFGLTAEALAALKKSLDAAPRNAQAVALNGFLLAAQNRIADAVRAFDHAIELDGALGNAWLGRGLCRIKLAQRQLGREDLLTAAALEPNRSLLRSYLGKAFADAGDDAHAEKEMKLARNLDPSDPTAWLYLALLEQQENQINPAIGDLQTAQVDNDNRSVFRSGLLLDQDRAVASANLAALYRDAGMTDVSVREAARAVTDDYANDSAHLFLSDSYYSLLDPTQFNLRYDTAWFNELLLANILAPVGGGRLSQQVSQQDYSKLFDSEGVGLASSSDVRTDGMVHQTASQFGTFNNTAYGIDLDYFHNYGFRVNNTLDNLNLDSTIKQQVGPDDTAMLLVQYENYHSGDNFQYYYQTNARPFYKFDEQQQPELAGTWHHEWAPGIHTLILLDRLVDDQQFSDKAAPQLFFLPTSFGPNPATTAISEPFDVAYTEKFQVYGAELNQICQWERVLLLAGGRYQSGEFQTQDQLSNPAKFSSYFTQPIAANTTGQFQRATGYSYLTLEPLEHLWLTGGLAADEEKFPYYFRNPPVSPGEDSRSQLGPKAALVWSPSSEITLRGIYTRSLGGVSIDESYRLEPTELAGFPQAFRSLISESVVGSQSAPTFETLGAALDLKLGARTYLGFQVERLGSDVDQGVGDFVVPGGGISATASSTSEQLDYVERTGSVSLNQLLGENFVVGADYKITQSHLHWDLPDVPVSADPLANQWLKATLQEVDTYLLFNHRSGFYAKFEAHWYGQDNSGWTPVEPAVSFAQENIFAGYRFMHRRAEAQIGILNLTGGGYDLNPLTVYQELARKRVFEGGLNFIF